MKRSLFGVLGALALVAGCASQETGGALVNFHAYAAGLEGTNGSTAFTTGSGFDVTLDSARIHIGAVYMRLGKTNAGSANASCVGDTTYGLQVPGSVDADVLSERLQEFFVLGNATTDLNQSGEIWLAGGDINQVNDPTVLVQVAGTAHKGAATYPFRASMTISTNRLVPPSNPATPGANPICKQRIIEPIPLAIQPTLGGNLLLRIDPRLWFDDVDFSSLKPSDDDPSSFVIPDVSSGPGASAAAGRAFYTAVTGASAAVYQFSWFTP